MLRTNGKIFILSGPSGAGKTTLYRKLLTSSQWKEVLTKSVSVTTRPRRPGERQGMDYIFVSQKMFLYKKKHGHFLECEEVFGNYYGTPKKSVRDLLQNGKNVLLCIDVKGAQTVQRLFPESVTIFVKTSSVAVLKKRLRDRGSEPAHVMEARLKRALEELKESSKYRHIVINDDLCKAFSDLENILIHEMKR